MNILLSFSDEVAPFKFKNNLEIILGSKSEKYTVQKVHYSFKKLHGQEAIGP